MRKILLLGYMGSGKSLIGKLVAERMHITHYDLDFLIEKYLQVSISEIFQTKGEIFFRKIEHQIFKDLLSNDETFVLSLGGGTPCYANNHQLLRGQNVISVYLSASIETLYSRLMADTSERPLLANLDDNDAKEFIAKHLFDRSYFYNQASGRIYVNGKTPNQICDEVMDLLT